MTHQAAYVWLCPSVHVQRSSMKVPNHRTRKREAGRGRAREREEGRVGAEAPTRLQRKTPGWRISGNDSPKQREVRTDWALAQSRKNSRSCPGLDDLRAQQPKGPEATPCSIQPLLKRLEQTSSFLGHMHTDTLKMKMSYNLPFDHTTPQLLRNITLVWLF